MYELMIDDMNVNHVSMSYDYVRVYAKLHRIIEPVGPYVTLFRVPFFLLVSIFSSMCLHIARSRKN